MCQQLTYRRSRVAPNVSRWARKSIATFHNLSEPPTVCFSESCSEYNAATAGATYPQRDRLNAPGPKKTSVVAGVAKRNWQSSCTAKPAIHQAEQFRKKRLNVTISRKNVPPNGFGVVGDQNGLRTLLAGSVPKGKATLELIGFAIEIVSLVVRERDYRNRQSSDNFPKIHQRRYSLTSCDIPQSLT